MSLWDGGLRYDAAAVCAVGRVRADNQDNIYLNGRTRDAENIWFEESGRRRALFAVADGMGGEANGAMASGAALDALKKCRPNSAETLAEAFLQANDAVCAVARKYRVRCGSTLTALWLDGGEAVMMNIGDSRCYLLRAGQLRQLSRDHTLARQLVSAGVIAEEEAATHPERHRLTQHLGIFPEEMQIEPYEVRMDTAAGDRFLLCSDGLTEMVSDEMIARVLNSADDVKTQSRVLYALAMEGGGRDNISVLIAAVR